jgi:hypothetical protein
MRPKRNIAEVRSIKIRIGDLSDHFQLESEFLLSRKEAIEPASSLRDAAVVFLSGKGNSQSQNAGPSWSVTRDGREVKFPNFQIFKFSNFQISTDSEEFSEPLSHTVDVSKESWIDWTNGDSDFFEFHPFFL